ncbi:MAG: hypothetical protein D4R88_00755 [Methanosarcinales archaeon]|nr:MAG: hypothetical protein D4R88_00755 [Methanosarcinales archaeon]
MNSSWIRKYFKTYESAISLISSLTKEQQDIQEQYNLLVKVSQINAIGIRRFAREFLDLVCEHFACESGAILTGGGNGLDSLAEKNLGVQDIVEYTDKIFTENDPVAIDGKVLLPIRLLLAGVDHILGVLVLTRRTGNRFEEREINALMKLCDLTAPSLHFRFMLDRAKLMGTLFYHSLIEIEKARKESHSYLQLYRLDKGRELWEWDVIAISLVDLFDIVQQEILPDKAVEQEIKKFLEGLRMELAEVYSNLQSLVRYVRDSKTTDLQVFIRGNQVLAKLQKETEFLRQPDINFISMKMLGIKPLQEVRTRIEEIKNPNISWLKDVGAIIDLVSDINLSLFNYGQINDSTLYAYALHTHPCDDKLTTTTGNDKLPPRAQLLRVVVGSLQVEYGIDAGAKIDETLNELARIEPIMYWGIKRYRDHLVHSCRIALLGLWLLDQKVAYTNNCPCDKECGQRSEICPKSVETIGLYAESLLLKKIICSITDKEKVPSLGRAVVYDFDSNYSYILEKSDVKDIAKKIWLLASLKHDIGYSFTYLKELYNSTVLMHSDGSHSINEIRRQLDYVFNEIFDIVRTHATSIGSSLYDLKSKRIPHGAIGAFHVRHLMEDEYVREIAARAISRHDDDIREVCFAKEPVSYLLILLDELQEWGRPIYTTHETNYRDLRVITQKLLAEDELLCITYKLANHELAFCIDYSPSEQTLEKTGFSFAHFLYYKQLNLSRLMHGPSISIHIKLTDLAKKQLGLFHNEAKDSGHIITATWAQTILDQGDEVVFDLGRNAMGGSPLSRPPAAVETVLNAPRDRT